MELHLEFSPIKTISRPIILLEVFTLKHYSTEEIVYTTFNLSNVYPNGSITKLMFLEEEIHFLN